MKNLEPLNDIFDSLKIKQSVLSIFHLDELNAMGKGFQRLPGRPGAVPCNRSYNLVFDYGNDSFCSIFSEGNDKDSLHGPEVKHLNCGEDVKLESESEILSSEFEVDHSEPILTSEDVNESAEMKITDISQVIKRQKC